MLSTVRALVDAAGETSPTRAIVLAPGRPDLTAGELSDAVDAIGVALRERGVGRNDRVAIVVPNGPEMAVSFLGVASHATAAPLNPNYTAADFDFYLSDLEARLVIVAADLESPVRDVAAAHGIVVAELRVDPTAPAGVFSLDGPTAGDVSTDGSASADDVALVLHTSGTSSRPKFVPLTHTNVTTWASNIATTLALTPDDRCLNVMPLFHIHGLMAAVLSTIRAGASIVCSPGFDADAFYGWLDRFAPTWYTAVPTMHQAVLAGVDGHRDVIERADLRFIRSSSASLPPPVMAALETAFDAPVIEAYGMTEAAHQMTSNPLPPAPRLPGSVGVQAGPDVAIMDADGALLATGEAGEIVIRGANVTAGYDANPEANATAFTGGWFRTGDEGVLDDQGYLRITGRLKEMINRGGEKVIPREIDEALLGHPAVAQAVAFAMPHPTLGEDLGAAVVLEAGSTADEAVLRAFCFDTLVGFKVPSRIVVVDAIPKGATGKLQRIGLIDKLGASLAVDHEAPVGELEALVAEVWGGLLGSELGRHDNFFSAGGDSLTATTAAARLASHAAGEIDPTDVFRAPTVAGFAALLGGAAVSEGEAFVELRPGTGRPVWCVPGHGGDPFTFLEMSRRLGGDRPVLSLTLPPELCSDDPETNAAADRRIAELGISMAKTAAEVQPDGPIDVIAYCFGGEVAQDMIAALEAGGRDVGAAVYVHVWGWSGVTYTRLGRIGSQVRMRARQLHKLVTQPRAVVRRIVAGVRGTHEVVDDRHRRPSTSTPVTVVKLTREMGRRFRHYRHDMGWGDFAPVREAVEIDTDKPNVFTADVGELVSVVERALDAAAEG